MYTDGECGEERLRSSCDMFVLGEREVGRRAKPSAVGNWIGKKAVDMYN